MTARAKAGLVLSLALMSATGCDELTEVVLVVQSDLAVPAEVDLLDLSMEPGPIAPLPTAPFTFPSPPISAFPLSVGFASRGETTSFSFVARLFIGGLSGQPQIVVSRTVSDVRFARGETRMLVLTLPRDCACEGTSCPLPGNPACDNLRNPTLEPFDPDVAPPSTMMPAPGLMFF